MKKLLKENSLIISLSLYTIVGFLAGGTADE